MGFQRRHFPDDRIGVGADHVMRHHAFELIEPPGADLGEHRALHRDGLGHHHIEGADAVGRQQQHAVVADRVDIGTLPRPILGGAGRWRHRGHWFKLSKEAPARATRTAEEKGDSSFRQRNELVFAGNMRETAGFPVLLWPVRSAPCWRRRNSTRCGAALPARRRRETSCAPARRLDRDAVAGPEDQQPRPFDSGRRRSRSRRRPDRSRAPHGRRRAARWCRPRAITSA